MFDSLTEEFMNLRTLKRLRGGACAAAVFTLFCGPSAFAQTPVTVVEYYNKITASYFLTGRAEEQAVLDVAADFRRTGTTFAAVAATGASSPFDPVCRYRITLAPTGYSSHFYGTSADCAVVANAALPNFAPENFDFAVLKPTAGVCPSSAPIPVFRTLRKSTPVDIPNHRYTVSNAAYQTMLRRGWTGEGAVFCTTAFTEEPARPFYTSAASQKNLCAAPRVGVSPITNQAYPDRPGTALTEKQFLRSFVDETYLWYREVEPRDPASIAAPIDYFYVTKTFTRTNSLSPDGSVRLKDEFHFTQATESAEATQAGIEQSYGIDWSAIRSSPPRNWAVSVVTPGSPADLAGVKRGDKLVRIGGIDFVNGPSASLNAALFPVAPAAPVAFEFTPAIGGASRAVTLTAIQLAINAVPKTAVLNTPNGKVGYLALTTFNTFTTEDQLVNAVSGLANAGINDLVLDLRYNGGGYVYISSQLAYMVAGAARTADKPYSVRIVNDKTATQPPFPFYNITAGYGGLAANQALPSLNLGRVFVLTTAASASASESFINGLRGIDVEVILIGGTTRGKPYGFVREDNCGTSYFSVQQAAANAKGETDYITGFAPKCTIADDLTKDLGATDENMLATALQLRDSGVCPAGTVASSLKRFAPTEPYPEAFGLQSRGRSFDIAQESVPEGVVASGTRLITPVQPEQIEVR